jgi:hypothetical protein
MYTSFVQIMIRRPVVSKLENKKEKHLRQHSEETREMQVKRFRFYIL